MIKLNSLDQLLLRESVNTSKRSPSLKARTALLPTLRGWAGFNPISVAAGGAFIRGTANSSNAHLDLTVSIGPMAPANFRDLCEELIRPLRIRGWTPRRRPTTVNVLVGSFSVDLLVLMASVDTSLQTLYAFSDRRLVHTNVYAQTVALTQVKFVAETRLLKLWRDHHKLILPSPFLEVVVNNALAAVDDIGTENTFLAVLDHIASAPGALLVVDPASSSNALASTISAEEILRLRDAAGCALAASSWQDILPLSVL